MTAFVVYLFFELFVLLALTFTIYVLLRSIISGAVYLPTSGENMHVILALAAPRPGMKAADLGSGDGRIVAALAQGGAEAHGYEVNPLLVSYSRRLIRRAGLEKKAVIHWKSFWREDLSPYDVIVVYGITYIMKRLEGKLRRELKPGAKVISNIFPFPDWKPEGVDRERKIFLYVKR